jgi:two-component system NarL family response regulator
LCRWAVPSRFAIFRTVLHFDLLFDGDQEIYKALEAGARGYLLKEMVHTDVLRAIRVVHSGKRLFPPEVAERWSEYFPQIVLTEREVQVLSFVAGDG